MNLVLPSSASLPATFEAGVTIVRLIIDVVIRSAVAGQTLFGAWGVFMNTAQSAIDTILDLYDYYLHQNWSVLQSNANDTAQAWRRSYDIRTARRVRGEQRHLDFAITNNAASGGSAIWNVSARMLLKGS